MDDTVELGVALLERLEGEVTLAEAVDRVETVTSNPSTTRRVLDVAAERGAIERGEGVVAPASRAHVSFESEVVQREGEFTCQRCGADISTGHFLRLDLGEVGPFGSSCVRTVVGRD